MPGNFNSNRSRKHRIDLGWSISIVREIRVAFCSAKDAKNATFAERKATIKTRTMLSNVQEMTVVN